MRTTDQTTDTIPAPRRAASTKPLSDPHIVDVLISERGKLVMASPWWPLIRPFAYKILRYRSAVDMADTIAQMEAVEVFSHLSDLLTLDVTTLGLDRVPAEGPVVLVSNHPTGIADGVVLFDAIKARRNDLAIFANRDAIRINPRLADMIVPVEWRNDFKSRQKSKETLKIASSAFKSERVVVLFPSGRLAYWHEGKLTERPWMTSALALARKNKAPIIPMHMGGRNSGLFYFLARVSTELRDMTVFNELLNKKNAEFRVHFGKPIRPERLNGDLTELTEQMRVHCAETLAKDPDAEF
ncbi:MAG: 1-acyl-sn-glycerol-3-phosphate acyltransferase [Roseibium sp.]|uniref:GNAT family N-acetyltransferase n=1 Tax=Roseibium sp. TaxID=1936156 RepID=UPI001B2949D2|nr:1-acyl-sn-glycerol-3-phosphate acyltransferase [Roseibium sp.]MBO6510470.1 1-acyl-sn-glycerol-3-phosphate acyltransferase [Roseibium sp.]MBO6891778.1 1-acyl-sn-glycerol-3-phosphate acyltransferase [Roseibium sp.]MBO6931434.1 1-acyl-sn-glycerol-3-phosphate acyltransferase [Roseibium sp.]